MMNKITENLKRIFEISRQDIERIRKNFHSEMRKGLSGKKSSLKMIPTYVERPKGTEKGEFLALDLGGTNFRVLSVKLMGKRKYKILSVKKFSLNKKHMIGTGKILFDFIADCIKNFVKARRMNLNEKHNVGFTFSFPIKQKSISSGILIRWTKGFKAKGVEGKDVVKLLNESLRRKGLKNTRIVGLSNDTVSTLVAKSYEDKNCDVGVILGTGTNACYCEKLNNITRYKGKRTLSSEMIINMEWGGFDKLGVTDFDKELDRFSENIGEQRLEKMVSGMYLGELVGIVTRDLATRGLLFSGENISFLKNPKNFKSEDISLITEDKSKALSSVKAYLRKIKIRNSTIADRKALQRICKIVSRRGARISAAAMISVVTKMDPTLSKKHTIAIDGSVYEKHPGFSGNIKAAIKEVLKRKSKNIKLNLIKDASGKGAALIAANG